MRDEGGTRATGIVKTTMIYTHVLNGGGRGVQSPVVLSGR